MVVATIFALTDDSLTKEKKPTGYKSQKGCPASFMFASHGKGKCSITSPTGFPSISSNYCFVNPKTYSMYFSRLMKNLKMKGFAGWACNCGSTEHQCFMSYFTHVALVFMLSSICILVTTCTCVKILLAQNLGPICFKNKLR